MRDMMKLPTALRSLWRGREGIAAVELGLFLPILAGIIIPLIDLGMGAYAQMRLVDAVQAGAEYAGAVGFNAATIQAAVESATNLTISASSITATQACKCAKADGSGLADPSPAGGPPCTGMACPGGTVGNPGTYVTVGASTPYTMIFNYPGFTNPLTLTAQTIIRIK